MSVHVCRQTENPRRQGWCACGKRLPEKPKPETLRRDPDLEDQIARYATTGLNIDPSSLIEHAQTRAKLLSGEYVTDPMHIRTGRNRLGDMREELADCLNHGNFWIQEHPDEMGSDRMQDVMIALRFVALAYDRLLED